MGAYMNEVRQLTPPSPARLFHSPSNPTHTNTPKPPPKADSEEPNWQHEFWGSNYKRLYVQTHLPTCLHTPEFAQPSSPLPTEHHTT
jgi:hypothetical protein